MAHESCNNFRPPSIPELEYGPMEYRGLYIDRLGPLSVESAQRAVCSGMHPGSGRLLNGLDSEQPRGSSEANTIGLPHDIWVPFVRAHAGQATSCQRSGGIGARVEIHPSTRVPGRGKCGLYCIGERGKEVALGSGEINRGE